MTVSLITLHNVKNYGSVLQAYATQTLFQALGARVELVDFYRWDLVDKAYLLSELKKSKWNKNIITRLIYIAVKGPSVMRKLKVFRTFIEKHLCLTHKQYYSFDDLQNALPYADIYCTGSDQVWNSTYNGGVLPPFFLEYAPAGKRRIAFSASIGKDALEDWEKEETRKLLKKYDAISVREESAVEILKQLGVGSVCILDPTLMLTGEHWKLLFRRVKPKKRGYVFLYFLDQKNKEAYRLAKKLADSKNIRLICFSHGYHRFMKPGRMACYPWVEEFLALIGNAQYVLTDSFHGTAFSINFNTRFNVIYPDRFESRLRSILEITGLEDRVLNNYEDLEAFDRPIDYRSVEGKLNKEREKGMRFLIEALGSNESALTRKSSSA